MSWKLLYNMYRIFLSKNKSITKINDHVLDDLNKSNGSYKSESYTSESYKSELYRSELRQSLNIENKEHEIRRTTFFDNMVNTTSSEESGTPNRSSNKISKYNDIHFDLFNNVCICMIDIVGFSSWCSNHLPNMIAFAMLEYNQWILTHVKKYKGIKKIELVGDSCMLMGGIGAGQEYSLTDCYIGLIRLAVDLLDDINTLRHIFKSSELNIRIGIHISDVIGIYLPSPDKYQMFGNDINVCSRLESSALPNTIHISEKTLICVQGYCTSTCGPCTRCVRGNVINQNYKGVGYKRSYQLFMRKSSVYLVNINLNFYKKILNSCVVPYTCNFDDSPTLCWTKCTIYKYICVIINVSNERNMWSETIELLDNVTKNRHFKQNIILLTNTKDYNNILTTYEYEVDYVLNYNCDDFYTTLNKIVYSYLVLSRKDPERRSLDLTPVD